MAEKKSIDPEVWQAQSHYEEVFLELCQLVKSFDHIAQAAEDENGSYTDLPWLWTLQRHLERVEAASEGFVHAVHVAYGALAEPPLPPGQSGSDGQPMKVDAEPVADHA